VRQRVTYRRRVLSAHRPAHHGEPVDVDVVEQISDIARPVKDGAAGLGIRQPDTRPVG